MFGRDGLMTNSIATFVSPKVAKPRLPIPFFVANGDFLYGRLVTFLTAVRFVFIRKW